MKSHLQLFAPVLKRLGFKKDYDSRAGGVRCTIYTKEFADRRLELQIRGDGQHRVSHFHNRETKFGCMCTFPTSFDSIATMLAAVEHETCRTDFKH